MNQRKILFNLMAMLTVAAMFALVGCDKSSTDPDNPADALVGSWQLTSWVVYYGSSIADPDSSEDRTDRMGPVVLTFNADGTSSQYDDGREEGNWTYTATADELILTSTYEGETDVVVILYEISDNTLTLTIHEEANDNYDTPERWIVQTLTKQ